MTARLVVMAASAALAVAAGTASAKSSHCAPPYTAGVSWNALHQSGIGCPAAKVLASNFLRNGRLDGWNCQRRIEGRSTRFACHKAADKNRTLAGSWHVH